MRPRELVVVTYNVGNRSDARVATDLRRLAGRCPDAILLCEVADRHDVLADVVGYRLHQGSGNGQAHVAVLVRNGHLILSSGYFRCTGRTRVGRWGAGPDAIATKQIAYVRIRFACRRVWLGATHLVPSVQRGGHTKAAQAGRARRIALYVRHVAGIRVWAARRWGLVFVGGDFNATLSFGPLRVLRRTRLIPSTAASHGKRAIDMVWHRARRCVSVTSVEALDGYSSDHRPVEVRYAITPPRKEH